MQSVIEPQVHIWTRHEYYRMAEAGLFQDKHVELIEGRVIEMSPMGSLHATAVSLAARTLEGAFGSGYFVRSQMPLDAGEFSEPEPDIAVIKGNIRDFKNEHPKTAVLIVEAAESSLIYDRTEKARLYAKLGILEYWILGLRERRLEIRRAPQESATSPSGFDYGDIRILSEDEYVSPLAKPSVKIPVIDLLP